MVNIPVGYKKGTEVDSWYVYLKRGLNRGPASDRLSSASQRPDFSESLKKSAALFLHGIGKGV